MRMPPVETMPSEKELTRWWFFLILLMLLLLPLGCGQKEKKGGSDLSGIGGSVPVEAGDQEGLFSRPPSDREVKGPDIGLASSFGFKRCEHPLIVIPFKGQETNFTNLVATAPAFGWTNGLYEGQRVWECGSYVRLAHIANCENRKVQFGEPASHLSGVFVVDLAGTPLFFEAEMSLVANRLPNGTLFQITSNFAAQILEDESPGVDPIKLVFKEDREFGLPQNAFLLQSAWLQNKGFNPNVHDLAANIVISSTKSSVAPATSFGEIKAYAPSKSRCRGFPPMDIPLPSPFDNPDDN